LLQSLGAYSDKLAAANADMADKTKRRIEAIVLGEQAFRKFVLPALEAVAQEIESAGAVIQRSRGDRPSIRKRAIRKMR